MFGRNDCATRHAWHVTRCEKVEALTRAPASSTSRSPSRHRRIASLRDVWTFRICILPLIRPAVCFARFSPRPLFTLHTVALNCLRSTRIIAYSNHRLLESSRTCIAAVLVVLFLLVLFRNHNEKSRSLPLPAVVHCRRIIDIRRPSRIAHLSSRGLYCPHPIDFASPSLPSRYEFSNPSAPLGRGRVVAVVRRHCCRLQTVLAPPPTIHPSPDSLFATLLAVYRFIIFIAVSRGRVKHP